MKRKTKLRILSSFLSVVLLLPITVFAMDDFQSQETSQGQEERLQHVFQSQLDEINADASLKQRNAKQSVMSTTKNLVDFEGNAYTIIENAPSGYMIYHNESGTFPEYAPNAPSPYGSCSDQDALYYFGPMEYYVKQGEDLVHTITGETLVIKENEENLAETSEELSDYYMETTDQAVLDYIEEGQEQDLKQAFSTRATEGYIPGQQLINNMDSGSEMSHATKVQNRYGQLTNGICGYVASAILLAWHDNYKNQAIIDNGTYYTKSRGYNVFKGNPTNYADGKTFSYNLWRWHSPSKATDNGGSYA